MTSEPFAPEEYPPPRHILRDLAVTWEHRPDSTSTAWLEPSRHLLLASGAVRPGVLATVVDLVGGGLAAEAAAPDWIATADLTMHLVPRAPVGAVVARGTVLRRGRTTAVIEVALRDDDRDLGLATLTFAVLPRRDTNPIVGGTDDVVRMTLAQEAPLQESVLERAGIAALDRPRGAVEVPVTPYVRNSLGGVQGGILAMLADVATEHAVSAACGRPVETVDLQMTYLALAREGPLRTAVDVLDAGAGFGTARVSIRDIGAAGRTTTIARTTAAAPA